MVSVSVEAEVTTNRVIDLTEDEVVLANLRALGIERPAAFTKSRPESHAVVLEAMKRAVHKHHRMVRSREIVEEAGPEFTCGPSRMRKVMQELRKDGSVIARPDPLKKDSWVYMPKVV